DDGGLAEDGGFAEEGGLLVTSTLPLSSSGLGIRMVSDIAADYIPPLLGVASPNPWANDVGTRPGGPRRPEGPPGPSRTGRGRRQSRSRTAGGPGSRPSRSAGPPGAPARAGARSSPWPTARSTTRWP